MPIKVFVSVGRTSAAQQEQFVSGIERYMLDDALKAEGLLEAGYDWYVKHG